MRQDSYHNVIDTLIVQVKQSTSKLLKLGQEHADHIIHTMTIYEAFFACFEVMYVCGYYMKG